MTLTPKNWKSFQHYTDRRPSWIKLHRSLLDDYTFSRLPVASRALAPLLWLLASEYDEGIIPCGVSELAFRLRCPQNEIEEAIKPLISEGFFTIASNALADSYQLACLEKRTSKTETQEREEKNPSLRSDWPTDYRDIFWKLYPRKVGKKEAFKKLEKVYQDETISWQHLLEAIGKIQATEARFIPHPATWLNQGRWDDEHGPINGRHLQKTGNIIGAADGLIDAITAFGEKPTAPPDIRGGAGENDVRLLSKG